MAANPGVRNGPSMTTAPEDGSVGTLTLPNERVLRLRDRRSRDGRRDRRRRRAPPRRRRLLQRAPGGPARPARADRHAGLAPRDSRRCSRPIATSSSCASSRRRRRRRSQTSWPGGRRQPARLAWAGPIAGPIEVDTRILHYAPVARETPAAWRGRAGFVGLTPRGLARTWGPRPGRHTTREAQKARKREEDGRRAPLRTAAERPRDPLEAMLPQHCNAVVISEQERAACAPLLAAAAASGAVLAVTAGPGATSVELPGGEITQVQAPEVADPVTISARGTCSRRPSSSRSTKGAPPNMRRPLATPRQRSGSKASARTRSAIDVRSRPGCPEGVPGSSVKRRRSTRPRARRRSGPPGQPLIALPRARMRALRARDCHRPEPSRRPRRALRGRARARPG